MLFSKPSARDLCARPLYTLFGQQFLEFWAPVCTVSTTTPEATRLLHIRPPPKNVWGFSVLTNMIQNVTYEIFIPEMGDTQRRPREPVQGCSKKHRARVMAEVPNGRTKKLSRAKEKRCFGVERSSHQYIHLIGGPYSQVAISWPPSWSKKAQLTVETVGLLGLPLVLFVDLALLGTKSQRPVPN